MAGVHTKRRTVTPESKVGAPLCGQVRRFEKDPNLGLDLNEKHPLFQIIAGLLCIIRDHDRSCQQLKMFSC